MMTIYNFSNFLLVIMFTSKAESNILNVTITPNDGYIATLYVRIRLVIKETHTDAADHLNQTTNNLKYLGINCFGLKIILRK